MFFRDPLFKLMNYDDLEDPEIYRVDGYHPVHIGDYLGIDTKYCTSSAAAGNPQYGCVETRKNGAM